MRKPYKPSAASVSANQRLIMSPKHAERLAAGRKESSPSDYWINSNPELAAAGRARRRLEDIQMARELGIDPSDL